MNNNYRNACTEVYEILNNLCLEDYNKIPKDLISIIEKNRNISYKFKLNENLDLGKQELLLETRAILFNLFRDYLSSPRQKEIIIQMQKDENSRKNLNKIG